MSQSLGEMLDSPVGYWNWVNDQAARVAAMLGACDLKLFDHLDGGPATAAQIAERAGLNPELMRRLVEFLAAESVLDADPDGRFRFTNCSRLL